MRSVPRSWFPIHRARIRRCTACRDRFWDLDCLPVPRTRQEVDICQHTLDVGGRQHLDRMGAVSSPTSSSRTSRRGRPKAEDSPASSDELLLAALRAFATRGYDGTSIRELNQQLGVSHNLLYRRFGSKEQLWRATVDRWIGEVVAELATAIPDDETDPLETLRRLIV